MKNQPVVSAMLYLVIFTVVLFAGNSAAEPPRVLLDGNPASREIAPVATSVIQGEIIMVSIRAENVEQMHSYSVKCSFNADIVSFEGASATLSPLSPPFLESANGKTAAFIAVPGNGTVEIAATQTGKNSETAVSGSGILGYLSFKAVAGGNPGITITEARIVDPEGTATSASVKR
jgi:hypothetical protein